MTAARKFQLEAQQLHYQTPTNRLDPYSAPSLSLTASPETPLRLKLYTLQPHTMDRLRAFTLDGIVEAARGAAAGSGKRNTFRKMTPEPRKSHRVVLSLDHGAVELAELQELLHRDGEHRNLAWDVTDIIMYHPDKAKPVTRPRAKRAKARRDATKEEATKSPEAAVDENAQTKSGRFVLTFGDEAEARRFTRMWHRRELQPPFEDADDSRPPIIVNAMIPL